MKRLGRKRKRMRMKSLEYNNSVLQQQSNNQEWVNDYKKTDDIGLRGRDAEDQIIYHFSKYGWEVKERPSNGHDVVFQKGDKLFYTDVKEINEYVDSGKSIEKGRVQIDKAEFRRWVSWEEKNNSKFILFVKINKADGSVRWRQSTTKELRPLILNKKKDPIKLSHKELMKFRTYYVSKKSAYK